MPQLHKDGVPLPLNGVTAADTIALLAGVNFISVIRVLAAIDILRGTYKVDDLLDMDAIPAQTITQSSTAKTRIRNTDKYVRRLVKVGVAHDKILRASARFPPSTETTKA